MKKLLIILAILLMASGCSDQTVAENPWTNHIPDRTGFLHPFPCHVGEVASFRFSDKTEEKDGCYIIKNEGSN